MRAQGRYLPFVSKKQTIRTATADCASEAVSDIRGLIERIDVHVESQALRDAGDRLDGIRYATNVLGDEHLLDASTHEGWLEALRVLRLTEQVAACSLSGGFASGVRMLRDRVAKLIESEQTPQS